MIGKCVKVLSLLTIGACLTINSTFADGLEGLARFAPLTAEGKNTIRDVMSDCANKSIDQLMANLEGVEKIVQNLKSISPLTALCFVFSDYEVRRNVETILTTDVKSGFFLMHLHLQINKVIAMGFLDEYISECVASLGIDGDVMHKYIDEEDYRGLVQYFLHMAPESFSQYD